MAASKGMEIQNALQKKLEDIEKRYIRPLQKEHFQCSARCFDNPTASNEVINACVQGCSLPVSEVSNYINSEFTNYQERLQHCVSNCNAQAKDQLSSNPSEVEVQKVSQWFEGCAEKCIDSHVGLLPDFVKRVEDVLRQKTSQIAANNKFL